MAKFRPIFKRRSRLTGEKIQPRQQSLEGSSLVETAALVDDGDVQPLDSVPMAGENWVKFFAFMFSNLRRWLRGFWNAPRFEHPFAWLLVSRNRARP